MALLSTLFPIFVQDVGKELMRTALISPIKNFKVLFIYVYFLNIKLYPDGLIIPFWLRWFEAKL